MILGRHIIKQEFILSYYEVVHNSLSFEILVFIFLFIAYILDPKTS